jgi:hypothetical protein
MFFFQMRLQIKKHLPVAKKSWPRVPRIIPEIFCFPQQISSNSGNEVTVH